MSIERSHFDVMSALEPKHVGMPVRRHSDGFEDLSGSLGCLRRIQHQFGPSSPARLFGQNIDQGLGDSLAAMVMVHIDVIALPGAQTRDGFGKVIKDHEADERAVEESAQKLRGAILKELLGIVLVRLPRRAALERLGLGSDKRR